MCCSNDCRRKAQDNIAVSLCAEDIVLAWQSNLRRLFLTAILAAITAFQCSNQPHNGRLPINPLATATYVLFLLNS